MINENNGQSFTSKNIGENQNISHEMCNSDLFFDIQKKHKIVDENKRISHEALFKKRYWRINDIAEFLECSVGHIYNLSSRGLIPKKKKGKFLVFIPEKIFEWVIQGDEL